MSVLLAVYPDRPLCFVKIYHWQLSLPSDDTASVHPIQMLENWFFILAVTGVLVHSQATSSQTFWPAAVPLAVRSPYLNAWMATLNGTAPLNLWPTFWNSDHVGALVFSCTLCLGVIDPKFPDLGLGGLCSS